MLLHQLNKLSTISYPIGRCNARSTKSYWMFSSAIKIWAYARPLRWGHTTWVGLTYGSVDDSRRGGLFRPSYTEHILTTACLIRFIPILNLTVVEDYVESLFCQSGSFHCRLSSRCSVPLSKIWRPKLELVSLLMVSSLCELLLALLNGSSPEITLTLGWEWAIEDEQHRPDTQQRTPWYFHRKSPPTGKADHENPVFSLPRYLKL